MFTLSSKHEQVSRLTLNKLTNSKEFAFHNLPVVYFITKETLYLSGRKEGDEKILPIF